MLVVRERPVDRVPEERNELHIRQKLGGSLRGERVHHVVRRGIDRQGPVSKPVGIRKAPPIPLQPAGVMEIEVVDLLTQRRQHVRVLHQVIEERCCAASLCADDEDGRKSPHGSGQLPILGSNASQRPLDRRPDRPGSRHVRSAHSSSAMPALQVSGALHHHRGFHLGRHRSAVGRPWRPRVAASFPQAEW